MFVRRCVAMSLLFFLPSFAGEAAARSNPEATAKLLAAAAAGWDARARDAEKNTPLILAAPQPLFGKERKIVEALVKAGAQVDAFNKDGMTALMAAASSGRDGMVRLLIENEAKVDVRDNDGWTALVYASSGGHWSAAKELIEAKTHERQRGPGHTCTAVITQTIRRQDDPGDIEDRIMRRGGNETKVKLQ